MDTTNLLWFNHKGFYTKVLVDDFKQMILVLTLRHNLFDTEICRCSGLLLTEHIN